MPTQRAWERMAVMHCCKTGVYVCTMKACWDSFPLSPNAYYDCRVKSLLCHVCQPEMSLPHVLPLFQGVIQPWGSAWEGSCRNNQCSLSPSPSCEGIKQVTLPMLNFWRLSFDEPASQYWSCLDSSKGFLSLTCQANHWNSLFNSMLAIWDKFIPPF